MAGKRPQIGDVIEIPTSKGLAYAQYSHKHTDPPQFGSILRVLPGLYPRRPADLQQLVEGPEEYYVMFPVAPAVRFGMVSIAGRFQVPDRSQQFPKFKRKVGKIWYIWDGTEEQRYETLPKEVYDLSMEEIVSIQILVARLEQGWKPADQVHRDRLV